MSTSLEPITESEIFIAGLQSQTTRTPLTDDQVAELCARVAISGLVRDPQYIYYTVAEIINPEDPNAFICEHIPALLDYGLTVENLMSNHLIDLDYALELCPEFLDQPQHQIDYAPERFFPEHWQDYTDILCCDKIIEYVGLDYFAEHFDDFVNCESLHNSSYFHEHPSTAELFEELCWQHHEGALSIFERYVREGRGAELLDEERFYLGSWVSNDYFFAHLEDFRQAGIPENTIRYCVIEQRQLDFDCALTYGISLEEIMQIKYKRWQHSRTCFESAEAEQALRAFITHPEVKMQYNWLRLFDYDFITSPEGHLVPLVESGQLDRADLAVAVEAQIKFCEDEPSITQRDLKPFFEIYGYDINEAIKDFGYYAVYTFGGIAQSLAKGADPRLILGEKISSSDPFRGYRLADVLHNVKQFKELGFSELEIIDSIIGKIGPVQLKRPGTRFDYMTIPARAFLDAGFSTETIIQRKNVIKPLPSELRAAGLTLHQIIDVFDKRVIREFSKAELAAEFSQAELVDLLL